MNNEMSMSFLSRLENVGFSRVVVSAFASQLDPTMEELADIRTAVSEAVTNAIVHGYADSPNRTVRLECNITGDVISVTVSDDGCGIDDIERAVQPFYTTKPHLERSGMGFSVMKAFMDEMNVESTIGAGTRVTMRKHLSDKVGR